MDIIQDFPFKHCDSCPECKLDVNALTLYHDDRIATRQLNVSCKNAELCKRLEEQRNVAVKGSE